MIPSVAARGVLPQNVHHLQRSASAEASIEPAVVSSVESNGEGSGSSGVIRNLVNGHYNGAAAVRLRIVHADRIADLQLAADQQVAAAERETLAMSLSETVQSFVSEHSTGDESITAALGAAATDFATLLGQPGADLDGALAELEEALRAALTEESVALTSLPEMGVTESPELITTLEAEASETTPSLTENLEDDALFALMAELRSLIDSSQTASSNVSVLPPLPEYSGQGRAYAKFLEMYLKLGNSEPLTEAGGGLEAAA